MFSRSLLYARQERSTSFAVGTQQLLQHLANGRYSINICWVSETQNLEKSKWLTSDMDVGIFSWSIGSCGNFWKYSGWAGEDIT